MNRRVISAWADALASGEYTQVDGWLETPEGCCADGVLCRLAVTAGVIPEPVLARGDALTPTIYRYADQAMYVPVAVRGWAGLDDDPQVEVGSLPAYLVNEVLDAVEGERLHRFENAKFWKTHELNDAGVSFDLIAEVVRCIELT